MRSSFLASLLVPVLLLTACAAPVAEEADTEPDVTSPAASDDSPEGDPGTAAQAARETLAARLGVDSNDIAVESAEAQEWSDSCLGLGGAAESCLQVITPGFAMVLTHNGTEYRYRTDIDGTVVREE
jgi:hypothetical protein